MANEDLKDLGIEDLGQIVYTLHQSSVNVGDPTGRGAAAREELGNRGYWYCDHDESVQPLPVCFICGRPYNYQTLTD